jgi:hypothetical protein
VKIHDTRTGEWSRTHTLQTVLKFNPFDWEPMDPQVFEVPKEDNDRITDEVSQILRSCVYVYIDPRNGEPFYIGKGRGGRLFAYLSDPADTAKVARIADIRSSGYEP